MNNRILYTKPSITGLEVRYATDSAANSWGEHCFDYINPLKLPSGSIWGCSTSSLPSSR